MRIVDDAGEVLYSQSFTCGCGLAFTPEHTLRAGEPMPFNLVVHCPRCRKYVATINPTPGKRQPGEPSSGALGRLWARVRAWLR